MRAIREDARICYIFLLKVGHVGLLKMRKSFYSYNLVRFLYVADKIKFFFHLEVPLFLSQPK